LDHSKPRQEVEAFWRQRVQDAKLHFDQALADAQTSAADAASRARADQVVLAARVEYMRLLRVWDDLVQRGKLPPE